MEKYLYNDFCYQHDIDKGLIGIDYPIKRPENLFKFYPLSHNSVTNLIENQFYAPHFFELNDILDGSTFLWYTSQLFSKERYKSQFKNFPDKIIEQIYKDDSNPERLGKAFIAHNWSNQTNRLGIISFTEQENNTLMWPHYSQEEGFQIKVNTEALHSYFLQCFEGVYLGYYPMNYVNSLECLDLSKTESNIIPILYAVIVKSDVWKYEKEWRFFLSKENMGVPYTKCGLNPMKDIVLEKGNRIIKYKPELIEEICVGANFINQKKFKFKRELENGKISSKTYFQISLESKNHVIIEQLLDYICDHYSDKFYFPITSINTDLNQKKFLTRGKERIDIMRIKKGSYLIERTGEFVYFDDNGNRKQ